MEPNPRIEYYERRRKQIKVEINKLEVQLREFSITYHGKYHEALNAINDQGKSDLTIYEVIGYLKHLRDAL